jgi:hypothetical protein
MKGRVDVKHIALAAGVYGAGCVAISTIAALLGVPGFPEFAKFLTGFYGFYGYSITWTGVIVGAFWGFVEGFIHIGIFALIYNALFKK